MSTVGFIGAGKMATALIRGFVNAGRVKASQLTASDVNGSMLAPLKELGVNVSENNCDVVAASDVLFVAVKPNTVVPLLQDLSPKIVARKPLVVSLAAGLQLPMLQECFGEDNEVRCIRTMPNIAVLVAQGAVAFSRGDHSTEEDGAAVKHLMSALGLCEEIPEAYMDAATGVSGCGPAYVCVVIEALADGGVKMGLPRDLAIRLATQTVLGASKWILDSDKHPAVLREEVCSPGGATIYAVQHLESLGIRNAFISAVDVAASRCTEISEENENGL